MTLDGTRSLMVRLFASRWKKAKIRKIIECTESEILFIFHFLMSIENKENARDLHPSLLRKAVAFLRMRGKRN